MPKPRLELLYSSMEERGLDAVALIPGANLYYLTGLSMHTSERVTLALFTRERRGYLLLPSLEQARARALLNSPMALYPWTDEDGAAAGWAALSKDLDLALKSVAVEYLNMRVLELEELERFAAGSKIEDAGPLLADLRMVKDAAELEAMRRAAQVIDHSLEDTLRIARAGMTERELAATWQLNMKKSGADSMPEEPIVASGPNSAAPHITSSDRPLQTGDMVIFDGWCQVDGYFTDITRTVAVGPVSAEMRNVYEVVRKANSAGRAAVMEGIEAQTVDRAARDVVDRAGYGGYFLHRTGHGLGLEVHEPPGIVRGNKLLLKRGMTFTVEPGIYVPGQGGVRIEDDVVVTQDGVGTLTGFPRDLITLAARSTV